MGRTTKIMEPAQWIAAEDIVLLWLRRAASGRSHPWHTPSNVSPVRFHVRVLPHAAHPNATWTNGPMRGAGWRFRPPRIADRMGALRRFFWCDFILSAIAPQEPVRFNPRGGAASPEIVPFCPGNIRRTGLFFLSGRRCRIKGNYSIKTAAANRKIRLQLPTLVPLPHRN